MTRPHLRTILWTLTTAVLVTPLVGIFGLRIYDTELIRQTETELITQAAFAQAAYRQAYAACVKASGRDPKTAGIAAEIVPTIEVSPDGERRFRPIPPTLNMRTDKILEESPDPLPSAAVPDACGIDSGRQIAPLLIEAQEVTLAGIRVVDSRGVIVASTRTPDIGREWKTEEVARGLTGHVVKQVRSRMSDHPDPPLDSLSRRGAVRLFVAVPVWLGERIIGVVVVSRTPVSLQKALYTNRTLFLILFAVIVLVSLLLSTLASWAIARPVRGLLRQIRAIETGEPSHPVNAPGTAEFAQLSQAMARMDEALRQRNTYVQNFARNVSHEFKTPLTSIRGAVELLQEFDEMPLEKRAAFLANIEADAARLDRLVTRLHELARAETTRGGQERTDVLEVGEQLVREFIERGVEVTITGENATTAVPREVVDSMIRNLVENARTHGNPPVVVSIKRNDTAINIDVEDRGEGVSQNNREHIFDTFFTTARDSGGTGLGLSIVRAMAIQHGGTVELLDTRVTTFRLVLPLAEANEPKQ